MILSIFIIPVFIIIVYSIFIKFNIFKLLIVTIISLLVAVMFYMAGQYQGNNATEVYNGSVVGKDKNISFFNESYDCNCRTTKKSESYTENGKRKTRYVDVTKCDTCYNQGYDFRWKIQSTIGNITAKYSRCNSTNKPYCERIMLDPIIYSEAQNGDPVSRLNSYINYIQAVPNSLYSVAGTQLTNDVAPSYPLVLYDLYKLDRVIIDGDVGIDKDELKKYNEKFSKLLGKLGPIKKVNAVMVITEKNTSYFDNIIEQWKGANHNDVIIVVGPKDKNIKNGAEWVRIWSWTKNSALLFNLQNEITENINAFKDHSIFNIIENNINKYFEKESMKKYEYLKYEIQQTNGEFIFTIIIAFLLSIGAFFVAKYDFSLDNSIT